MKTDKTRDDDANQPRKEIGQQPSEDAIDEADEESFPASDPVSVSITKKK
jgi:hypothetical protein